MDFAEHFPIWDKLTPEQQQKLTKFSMLRTIKKGIGDLFGCDQ